MDFVFYLIRDNYKLDTKRRKMEWLNLLEQIANIILPFGILCISYITGKEQIDMLRGLKNIDCKLVLLKNPQEVFKTQKPIFLVTVMNKGFASQNMSMIMNDKKEVIYPFLKKENTQIGRMLKRGESVGFPLNINDSLLEKT